MNSVSNKSIISIVSKLLVLVIIAKVITLSMLYFLPSSGLNKSVQKSYVPEYKRYKFSTIIAKEVIANAKKVKKVDLSQAVAIPSNSSIDNVPEIATLVLKGLYGSKESSFVFISKKSNTKEVKMLRLGESFEGYTLIRVEGSVAVFNLNDKEFILRFGKVDTKKYAHQKSNKKVTSKRSTQAKAPRRAEAATVGRSEIQYYAKNFKQIWKDIAILPLKKKGKIIGFKVTRIKANTPFAKLGLRVGDIIIRANNIELKSYKDALKIYEKIDDLNAVEIVVLRDNEEVELVYEIY